MSVRVESAQWLRRATARTLVNVPDPTSYILCGTPRTGSTLLCSLLASTKVAGLPESYFREPDQDEWATRFGVSRSEDGRFDYTEFVAGAVRYGSTPNGVFAARVMWGTLHPIVTGLVPDPRERGDVDVLEQAFGTLRFVYLQRNDVVEQAVSWARAEQSAYWQHGDEVHAQPRLDIGQVHGLVGTIREHNAAWQAWFAAQAVEPLRVEYESLISDPQGTVTSILEWIRIKAPRDWKPVSPHKRQADEINAEWVQRYRALRE